MKEIARKFFKLSLYLSMVVVISSFHVNQGTAKNNLEYHRLGEPD